ncbi:MAG: RNA-binding cell elongation regulator Jag/EloR [Candidatus Margulisiibacteriota bacterium]
MKSIIMKGKNVEEAKKNAMQVMGVGEEKCEVRVISEGKSAVMGIIGGEEAEVEVMVKGTMEEEALQILQNILDKMGFMTIVNVEKGEEGQIELNIKGDDMGRIIGKEGNSLKALEILVRSILFKMMNEKAHVSIDAGGYKEKRIKSLERLAQDVVDEVKSTGKEKRMPQMHAGDRRIIHMFLKDNPDVTSYSSGEGDDRRLVIAPK